jgi:hypothetical protein
VSVCVSVCVSVVWYLVSVSQEGTTPSPQICGAWDLPFFQLHWGAIHSPPPPPVGAERGARVTGASYRPYRKDPPSSQCSAHVCTTASHTTIVKTRQCMKHQYSPKVSTHFSRCVSRRIQRKDLQLMLSSPTPSYSVLVPHRRRRKRRRNQTIC